MRKILFGDDRIFCRGIQNAEELRELQTYAGGLKDEIEELQADNTSIQKFMAVESVLIDFCVR